MPAYSWLLRDKIDFDILSRKLTVMQQLGVPYTDYDVGNAAGGARAQAKSIAEGLREQGAPGGLEDKEIVALIAYLQSLGQLGRAKAAAN